ncbi:hypothetical protein I3843_16G075400 [Carya illinoinensis]|uniref:Uncharacterized protein n=1 Tax=Carya illinoinensis TaxID=32201 RepID=A0A922A0V4_CARIL|nr:transcription repressor MYB6-like isoform X2 [Carya illinoinensis]KAG2664373.1 hypothetical protein I3760_16G079100 [Carya illinoinensis]KAG6672724.1 hypothetical protein I3842_16G073900 [Carya illinoinensis]KAG7941965.1 hypothetical protein I3843_16G075400 [Carya illinoinensis]
MGSHRCCNKQKIKRGLWSPEEDEKLIRYLTTRGHGSWSSVPKLAGLHRCGKSCRLRWINYLRPDLKRGSFSPEEEQIIIDIHRIVGNKWAQIAKHLPGRTDNEVKNFWNSCIKKRFLSQGLDPNTHNLISSHQKASGKVAFSISQSRHQQPISVFTLNSQNTDSMKIEIPNRLPSSLLQTMAITSTTEDRNPNVASNSGCTPYISSSSSSSSLNSSGFGIINHERDTAPLQQYCGTPRIEGEQPILRQERQLEKNEDHQICELETDQISELAKANQNMNASVGSSDLDQLLDQYMESTLMSGLMHYDLSYIDDLAWK